MKLLLTLLPLAWAVSTNPLLEVVDVDNTNTDTLEGVKFRSGESDATNYQSDGDDPESRLLTGNDAVLADPKVLSYKSAGDYTLISVPWSSGTSLAWNDTAASTLSTLGNAALLVGGLYLLSGFPTAASAKADPFGISRRFGAPALHNQPKHLRPRRLQKKSGKHAEDRIETGKSSNTKHKKNKVSRRKSQPSRRHQSPTQSVAQERQLPRPFSLPEMPNLRPPRPLNFRLPTLPSLRLPQLPRLRRPTLPQINNPFRRPTPARRPAAQRPAIGQPSRPVVRPIPTEVNTPVVSSFAVPDSQPSFPAVTPFTADPTPSPPQIEDQPSFSEPDSNQLQFSQPQFEEQQISQPQFNQQQFSQPQFSEPEVNQPSPSDFGGGAFDGQDPFGEFQSSDFGSDESFRDLISQQFGSSFDIERLPKQ